MCRSYQLIHGDLSSPAYTLDENQDRGFATAYLLPKKEGSSVTVRPEEEGYRWAGSRPVSGLAIPSVPPGADTAPLAGRVSGRPACSAYALHLEGLQMLRLAEKENIYGVVSKTEAPNVEEGQLWNLRGVQIKLCQLSALVKGYDQPDAATRMDWYREQLLKVKRGGRQFTLTASHRCSVEGCFALGHVDPESLVVKSWLL